MHVHVHVLAQYSTCTCAATHHNAERPDVHFGPVVFAGDHLRRHPVRRAHHCAPLVLLGAELRAEAEVGYEHKYKYIRVQYSTSRLHSELEAELR